MIPSEPIVDVGDVLRAIPRDEIGMAMEPFGPTDRVGTGRSWDEEKGVPMSPETEAHADSDERVSEREVARRRLQARRDFGSHLVAYVVVNLFLVAVWAFTGAGYFWPAWVMFGWGAGLVLHAWDVFLRRPVTEAEIDEELSRHDTRDGLT